jgi:hypothetical protein
MMRCAVRALAVSSAALRYCTDCTLPHRRSHARILAHCDHYEGLRDTCDVPDILCRRHTHTHTSAPRQHRPSLTLCTLFQCILFCIHPAEPHCRLSVTTYTTRMRHAWRVPTSRWAISERASHLTAMTAGSCFTSHSHLLVITPTPFRFYVGGSPQTIFTPDVLALPLSHSRIAGARRETRASPCLLPLPSARPGTVLTSAVPSMTYTTAPPARTLPFVSALALQIAAPCVGCHPPAPYRHPTVYSHTIPGAQPALDRPLRPS